MALFVINTISATKFSINGREMFKTFTPVFLSDAKISVVNIYDSSLSLFDNSLVSEIEVNSVIYANATDLITALVPVIFIPAGEGTFSQTQIDQNTADILDLQNNKADINHDHNTLYYLKTEIDSIIAGLGSGTTITSGAVVGQKLVFYDSMSTVIFEIDVKKFFEQGSNLTYVDGVLKLENVYGTVLSTINLTFQSIAFQDFVYTENIQLDFSNVIYVNDFVLAKTISDTFFFLKRKDSTFDANNIRFIFEEGNFLFDFTTADVENATYLAYEITVLAYPFIEGNLYRFDFRRNIIALDSISGLKYYVDTYPFIWQKGRNRITGVINTANEMEANDLIINGFANYDGAFKLIKLAEYVSGDPTLIASYNVLEFL